MMLDPGEVWVGQWGDVAIRRATMHAWRNITGYWARILFILQCYRNVEVGENVLNEDLGRGAEGLPPSAKAVKSDVKHISKGLHGDQNTEHGRGQPCDHKVSLPSTTCCHP